MTEKEFLNELDKLSIRYSNYQLKQLDKYYNLLISYNKIMNLTSIIEKKEVYLKHFYDSLTISRVINLNEEKNLCDIGTGAGFPGIVIKIFYPKLKITLIDSLNKRIKFLNVVIKELELKEIETIHSRIEDYAHESRTKYDVVTSRAVAPLNILLEYAIPILKLNGYFIGLKGKEESEDTYINALKILNSKILKIEKFKLPNEGSDRTIYKISKLKNSKKIFPRKYSIIKNNPL